VSTDIVNTKSSSKIHDKHSLSGYARLTVAGSNRPPVRRARPGNYSGLPDAVILLMPPDTANLEEPRDASPFVSL